MHCWKNTYFKRLKKSTNPEIPSSFKFYLRKSVFNSSARSPPPVLFVQAERGDSPEGKPDTRPTQEKIPTVTPSGYWHWAVDALQYITPPVCIHVHFQISTNAHKSTSYTCLLKQPITTERTFQELEITHRKSIIRIGTGMTVPP